MRSGFARRRTFILGQGTGRILSLWLINKYGIINIYKWHLDWWGLRLVGATVWFWDTRSWVSVLPLLQALSNLQARWTFNAGFTLIFQSLFLDRWSTNLLMPKESWWDGHTSYVWPRWHRHATHFNSYWLIYLLGLPAHIDIKIGQPPKELMAPARQATGSMEGVQNLDYDAVKEESEEEQNTSDEEVWCSGVLVHFLGRGHNKN